MFRRGLSDIDRAAGGLLRRIARRGTAGPVISLAADRDRVAGLLDYTVLHSARTVGLDDEDLCAFLRRQTAVPHQDCSFQTEEVFLATLADVTFDPHSGAVWTADGALIIDSIKNTGRLKHVAAAPVAPGVWPGLYSSVASPISGNPFHWLIETLPRLYSLAQIDEPVVLLMPDNLAAARQEQLIGCLPPNVSLRLVPAGARLRVERFVLPSFLTRQWDFAFPPAEHLAFVRDRLIAACGLSPEPIQQERIYISRARARVRRVSNEAAVLDVLRPLGFRPWYLEDLPLAEQVRLFRDAEAVIAPHGAGLANLLFAGRVPVLELTSRVVSPVYFFLTLALGQPYHWLYPPELEASLPSPADGRLYSETRDRDITIDLDALRTMTDEWLQEAT